MIGGLCERLILMSNFVARETQLDVYRGIALWFVFVDHIPNNPASWFTLRYYGFSDATEVFMFVSGMTCAVAYHKILKREGWCAVVSHAVGRSWEIYCAFLLLILACIVSVHLAGADRFADQMNIQIFMNDPGAALSQALILQYRSVNTDVLPNFVVYHALFAGLLWSLLKAPNLTLAGSFAIYFSVQIFGWNLPQWPSGQWYFNPFAWQVLVVFGAWWVIEGRHRLSRILMKREVTVIAAIYLLLSTIITVSWHIPALDRFLPNSAMQWIYPIDKPNLDVLRLLHFIALAVIVSRIAMARIRSASTLLRGAILCGENSLEVYCGGVLLAFGCQVLLERIDGGLAMRIAMSVGGVLLLIGFANLLTYVRIQRQRQPKLF